MRPHPTISVASALSITALLTFSGCGSASTPTAEPSAAVSSKAETGVSDDVHYRARWADGPIDLMSPTGTFIRAFTESYFLAVVESSDTKAFPGYARANRDREIRQYGQNNVFKKTVDIGMKLIHVDNQNGDTAVARVCYDGIDQLDYSDYPPMLSPQNPQTRGTGIFLITFHRTGTTPPPNQRGPLSGPLTDVFGGWYATKLTSTWHDDDPTKPHPKAECGTMPDLTKPGTSTPGWPKRGE